MTSVLDSAAATWTDTVGTTEPDPHALRSGESPVQPPPRLRAAQAPVSAETRPRRTPALVQLGTVLRVVFSALARRISRGFAALRRVALSLTGFGFLCWGAWQWSPIAGAVAIGLSCLILEALSSHDTSNGE